MRVWMNGMVCDEDEARVSLFDHGLLTGDGVFETLEVVRGVPFALRRHLERLARSAEVMRLELPDPATLRQAAFQVVEANSLTAGRVRITVTGGPSPLGSERGAAGPLVIVVATSAPAWPPTTDVAVVPWPRNERGALAGVKTISYGENVVALAFALERGASEAIFANLSGNLCEGTGSNVFLATGGRLLTPPLSSGCLAGVTRALVLEVAGAEERDLPVEALASAQEAFLTSSTRRIQPIRAVDGQALAAAPGPLTAAAINSLEQLMAGDLDP